MAIDVNNAWRYHWNMIRSFRARETEKLFNRERTRAIPASLRKTSLRRLLLLDAASSLEDLRVPPGNRLEKLKGDRRGQHSIRINQQYRICFTWSDGSASEVEVVDYH